MGVNGSKIFVPSASFDLVNGCYFNTFFCKKKDKWHEKIAVILYHLSSSRLLIWEAGQFANCILAYLPHYFYPRGHGPGPIRSFFVSLFDSLLPEVSKCSSLSLSNQMDYSLGLFNNLSLWVSKKIVPQSFRSFFFSWFNSSRYDSVFFLVFHK